MTFFETLKRLDKLLFILIHNDSDHFILDNIMLAIRNPYTWIPLYAFILFYAIKKAGNRAWLFILLSILTFVITDGLSASVLKPFFARIRPCGDPELIPHIRNLIDCGGMYSFPSSHASNHFGLAAFWFWSVWKLTGNKWHWLWVWAALIGYAQIYVGKHFPLDIVAGALLGWVIGNTMAKAFEFIWESKFKQRNMLITT
jgi:undecaprenyl-diphosphatase